MSIRRKKLSSYLLHLFLGIGGLLSANWCHGGLPEPATGGLKGGPISILTIMYRHELDATYAAELKKAGYRVETISLTKRLSAGYLHQFNVVILTDLPEAGDEYKVYGYKLADLNDNLKLLQEYVEQGGGLLFEPSMSQAGKACAARYNPFLAPYDVRFSAQQLRDDAETLGAYAVGEVHGRWSALTRGLHQVLYPIMVLRWDHAYSTTPFIPGKGWTVLARGKKGSGTHIALDNERVTPKPLTFNRDLLAWRRSGKGMVAVSAIHSYYTLTAAYSKKKNLGENATGVIDGIVLHGEKNGRPSDFGALLDRLYRFLGRNSAANGFGGAPVPLPQQAAAFDTTPVIDWETATPPPSWRHRVIPIWKGKTVYYEEKPDPAIRGKLKFYRILVGARTKWSDGAGTVKAYREAAIAAGYSAIAFTETFESLTPENWQNFLAACASNSDDQFVCLPGLDIQGFQGERYLVVGGRSYPEPTWLTPDGKRLRTIRMLSLGWFGHVSVAHRPGHSPIDPRMLKHYQGISVYTYDENGKQVDDGLSAYQWSISTDSNPIPFAVHEVRSPAQVALAAASGFQQILPAVNIVAGMDYFRYGLAHYFECPVRYFLSEGPLLTGWSILNKDIGRADQGRDHYCLGIGIRATNPITRVTLYDGFNIAGRWLPKTEKFKTRVDGFLDQQRQYLLLARDAKGKRVLSPQIRTVCRNWRARCGDRQNWLGSMFIYTGTPLKFGSYLLPIRQSPENGCAWIGNRAGNPCAIYDFPFFSNHVKLMSIEHRARYINAKWQDIAYDAKPPFAIRPSTTSEGVTRVLDFVPQKRQDFATAIVDLSFHLLRPIEPVVKDAIYPRIVQSFGKNKLLILPNKPPQKLSNKAVDLPVGAYAGGIIALSPGLRVSRAGVGFAAPPKTALTLPAGTAWSARYLLIKAAPFTFRQVTRGFDIDKQAEPALRQMGFRGQPPYRFDLTRGHFDRLAFEALFTAAKGGIAGQCQNPKKTELLYNVPLVISGLNPRQAAAVWRADRPRLEYFAVFNHRGYVTFNADQSVQFYAGNVATCDPNLFVSVVKWDAKVAHFRVNNPTAQPIVTDFATAREIAGFKPVNRRITVPAGSSLEIREPIAVKH